LRESAGNHRGSSRQISSVRIPITTVFEAALINLYT
jgi:hypothetical protein